MRVSADLIRQKLPFNEIMQLLVNDIQNRSLRESIKDINTELKQGKDSEKAFVKHEAVLGRFTAHMLGLASKSGNMAEIYESTAKFLERQAEFKKNLKIGADHAVDHAGRAVRRRRLLRGVHLPGDCRACSGSSTSSFRR